ncbi:hypothetical protein [Novosphingobium sp. FSW06-99]|uniref:hypothetical protein n=1 Tax=Novosphingobium sp. FSW06-99 TaxID=1739113 RepID=UPI00076D008D|nr:hypothetical protein [Novosphingobium sp. FSW06-99]KUR78218.1 hypothetical protein AQZ49_07750 [Novosphingobium sp. FSW06-99]
MTMQFRHLPENVLVEGTISDEAIVALRRQIWPDGVVDIDEVEEILALNEEVRRPSKAWIGFFVEAVTEFLMNTSEPRGYLSEAQADWLIVRMDRDGRLDSPAKLELLVHLLERMDGTPARMNAYILVQIERAVVFGAGPTRDADHPGTPPAGCITAEECALIRRVIFAPSSTGASHVSVEEAEMLFRIKDATLGADNAPEWQTLFVQGVANYLQGWQGARMPSAEQEAAHQRFLDGRNPGVGGVLRKMARLSPNGLLSEVRSGGFGRRQPPRDHVAEQRATFAVTDSEQNWLDTQVATDGEVDPLEAALIAFLRDDA